MSHSHLNYLKRCQILVCWKAGYSGAQIAREVGVHRSTITNNPQVLVKYLCRKLEYHRCNATRQTPCVFYSYWSPSGEHAPDKKSGHKP